ncbi:MULTISPECIES: CvpA family protein [Acidiphilium]|uniref:Membrane protein required for colicin V production n=1 Tax=Acidiphilium rubrum TaxID=526 RepID=A0A8G2FDX3_ACIRU|nr:MULTISPECIES: CvpA family protein [Acidiphilium]SIR05031.1 membrane protein required for colicin V production [Acidiphilium rubrum]
MTWVDGIALLIIVLSGLLALARGLVREILGVGAWIGAGLAAFEYYPDVETLLAGYVHQPLLILLLSFGLIFIIVLIILSILSAWLGSMMRDSVLSGIDRTLGLAFGLARGVVIVCLLYKGLSMFLPPSEWPAGISNARLLPYAESGSQVLVGLLPAAYQPHIDHMPVAPTPAVQPAAPAAKGSGQ